MSNGTTAKPEHETGLDGIDARRDINRIANAIIKRKITTAEVLTSECLDVAHEHYVEIVEVYRKVWAKVSISNELHLTHPAGKTKAYHTLRERAGG